MAKVDEFDIKIVNTAATELAESIAGTAMDLIPQIQTTYKLEGHLVNLVLARAWVRCAVAATSQVTRMTVEECAQLEQRINQAITDAVNKKRA